MNGWADETEHEMNAIAQHSSALILGIIVGVGYVYWKGRNA